MIEIKNVTKIYELNKEKMYALDDVSLTVDKGQLIVLQGASGSGKSTLLSLIAGLSKPTSGEIIIDNKRISKLPDDFASVFRRDNIGFIFQKYNLIPNLSVKENIITPLVPLNLPQENVEKKLLDVAKMFHISHKLDIPVKNLSGGEQQRVAIARANVNDPKIIIADEPTANLDEKLSLHFIEMLKELKELHRTIIVATHDPLFFDLELVDEIVHIKNGKILR